MAGCRRPYLAAMPDPLLDRIRRGQLLALAVEAATTPGRCTRSMPLTRADPVLMIALKGYDFRGSHGV